MHTLEDGMGWVLVLRVSTTVDLSFAWTFQGAGTDEKTLIEILATRTNAEIRAINEAYKEGKCGRARPSAAGKQGVSN